MNIARDKQLTKEKSIKQNRMVKQNQQSNPKYRMEAMESIQNGTRKKIQ
jgi:hypothetical protein